MVLENSGAHTLRWLCVTSWNSTTLLSKMGEHQTLGFRTVVENPLCTPSDSKIYNTCTYVRIPRYPNITCNLYSLLIQYLIIVWHVTDPQHYHLNRSTLPITDLFLEGGWVSHIVFTYAENRQTPWTPFLCRSFIVGRNFSLSYTHLLDSTDIPRTLTYNEYCI
jgi:hypothetical protein